MKSLSKYQYLGIFIVLLSLLVGFVGTVWEIYSSFKALETAENAGLGPVSAGLGKALFFTIGGIVGVIVGAGLLIFGRTKSRPD